MMKIGSNSISNIIAFIALIISIAAGIFSYNIYRNDNKEKLLINTTRVTDGYFVEIDTTMSIFPTVKTYWECILTNNGKHTISIIDYETKQVDSQGIIHYSNLDLGLFDGLNKISLPINIPSGESVKFYCKINVRFEPKALEVLQKHLPNNNQLTFRDFQYHLAKDSIDLFGNKLDVKFYENELFHFSVSPNRIESIYGITFTTGKHSKFVNILSWYPMINNEP